MISAVIGYPARLRAVALLACIAVSPLAAATPAPAGPPGAPRFNRDIRPILSARCFPCHGPDGTHRKADLRLDEREGIDRAFAGGRLEESEAWRRITASDPDERMPPPGSNLELEAAEIARICRWIEDGARWEGHWSFVPPVKTAPPAVKDPGWPRSPIDRFILARLDAEELSPSPEADRERLIRRLGFDLTGLPPTLEELDAFLADESPDACERAADRLLASPRYGERMAIAWMDAARYGDTSVFHADGPRDMWPWRDWVIAAYNAGKPFDDFTREQLAGDLLPEPKTAELVATGFVRNNATTDEGGAIPEEYRVEYAVDRVKTTSMVWLGLTLECAQCHDHKYDPFTQDDYYRLFAYFNQAADPGMQTRGGNQAPVVDVPNPFEEEEVRGLSSDLARAREEVDERRRGRAADFERWTAELEASGRKDVALPSDAVVHLPLDDGGGETAADAASDARSGRVSGKTAWIEGKLGGGFELNGGNFIELGDAGDFEREQGFSYGCWVRPEGEASGAPLARMDDSKAHRGYDLFTAGGRVSAHVIHHWPDDAVKVTAKAKLEAGRWQHVFVTYDGSSSAAGLRIHIDGKVQEAEVERDALRDTIRSSAPLTIGRRTPGAPFRGAVDDVRVYARALSEEEVVALAGADPIAPLLAIPAPERTADQVEALRTFFLRGEDERYRELEGEVARLEAAIAQARKPISTVMVMQDVEKPRATFVLHRGSYDAPLSERPVEPRPPEWLAPLGDGAPPNRLGLARWILRPDHPLTARVAVNRWWSLIFGAGIVETIGDFGSQGDWPSHPELLDWLAVDLVESGWDVKRRVRGMVLSATYRQSSRLSPDLAERDPRNRLLARGPRFRLQAELIRDNALAASGLLVSKIGGPGVKPYQPPGLWNEVSLDQNVRFVQDHGEDLYRRSLYTYWKRSAPAPSLTIFDTPTREQCVLRRSTTNTPLQALVTLNDPQFVEAARLLARRAMDEVEDGLAERCVRIHRLATSVRPTAAALDELVAAYEAALSVFREAPERAAALLSVGERPRREGLDAAEHAALTIVASIVLNLDETLTRG